MAEEGIGQAVLAGWPPWRCGHPDPVPVRVGGARRQYRCLHVRRAAAGTRVRPTRTLLQPDSAPEACGRRCCRSRSGGARRSHSPPVPTPNGRAPASGSSRSCPPTASRISSRQTQELFAMSPNTCSRSPRSKHCLGEVASPKGETERGRSLPVYDRLCRWWPTRISDTPRRRARSPSSAGSGLRRSASQRR